MRKNYNILAREYKETKSEKSFTQLYNAIKTPLNSFILSIVKDSDVTDDILQKTMIKVCQKIDQFDTDYAITTWVYTIAKRECFRWMKRHRDKHVSLSIFTDDGMHVSETEDGVNTMSFNADLNEDLFADDINKWDEVNETSLRYDLSVKAINNLKPMYREILVDNLVNGLKYKEIVYVLEPHLQEPHQRFENGEMTAEESKRFNAEYKKVLQKVKNRIRRGKMIIAEEVEKQMSEM